MRFLFLIILFLTAPCAAQAQQAVSETLLQGQAAYVAKIAQLTEAQRQKLFEMDKQYAATLQPMLDAFDMGGKMLFCMRAKGMDQNIYVAAFKNYQAERVREQEDLWDAHRDIALGVDYIDHALLDQHYAYIKAVQVAMAQQHVDQNNRTGQYNRTNCGEVQQQLDAAAKRAKNAMPPGATFDGTSGTLGTPQE